MPDVWNGEAEEKIAVTVVQNGVETVYEFAPSTTISEAVGSARSRSGLGSVIVKDADGMTVNTERGSDTLGSIGDLEVFPKAVAA